MKRKYRKRKFPKYFFIVSLVLFLFIGVGYSVIYSNLSLQGNVTKKANSWNIKFDNPVFDDDSMTSPEPTITNGTTMTMNVTLSNPGDKYAFTIDLINAGNLPALIKTINMTQLTEEQNNYLRYKVEYEDESKIEENDLLKAGETKKVHILLEYKKLRATDLYPSSNVNLNLNIALNFYLPEETYNTITLTKNSSSKTIEVSNLVQESTLTDFPIEDADKVIACNNGIEPTTDENNNIVLKKVKQDATCRIETSLANAVTNSGTEKTNISILQDFVTDEIVSITSNQNIFVDINGTTINIYYNSENDLHYINNNGTLIIKNNKSNGKITSNKEVINNTGNLLIKYITIESLGKTIITADGYLSIVNSNIISNNKAGLLVGKNSIIDVTNSNIENSNSMFAFVLNNDSENSITNIRSSLIKAASSPTINLYSTKGNNKVYVCDSQILTSNTSADINDIKKIDIYFYYFNTIFSVGGNSPVVTYNYKKNAINSQIACAE